MSSNSLSASLYNVERAAERLDAQVINVIGPLRFSHDPQRWNDQIEELFSIRYQFRVEDTENKIRAVAQKFIGTERVDQLLQRDSDFVDRAGMVHGMLVAVNFFALPDFHLPKIEFQLQDRLQEHLPTFCSAMNTITGKIRHWQNDFREWHAVFNALESAVVVELLLHSIPATVPDAHITQGREVITQLVELWNTRREVIEAANRLYTYGEDPMALMECLDAQREPLSQTICSFMDAIKQLDELPPLRLPNWEFVACQLFEADRAYSQLSSLQDLISGDLSRLERIFGHILDMIDAARLPTPQ